MKKLIALLLTLSLLISCVPVAFAAQTEEPEETREALEEVIDEMLPLETEEIPEETEEIPEVTEETEEVPQVTEEVPEETEEVPEETEEVPEETEEVPEETEEVPEEEEFSEEYEEVSQGEADADPIMELLESMVTAEDKASIYDAPTNVYVCQTAAKRVSLSWNSAAKAPSYVVVEIKFDSAGNPNGIRRLGVTKTTNITVTVGQGYHVFGIFPCDTPNGKGYLGDPAAVEFTTTKQLWRAAPKITAKQVTGKENTLQVTCSFIEDAVNYLIQIDEDVYAFDRNGNYIQEQSEVKSADPPQIQVDEAQERAVIRAFSFTVTYVNMNKMARYESKTFGAAVGVVDNEGHVEIGKISKTVTVKMVPQWSNAPKITYGAHADSLNPTVRLQWSYTGEPDYFNIYDGKNYLGYVTVDEGDSSPMSFVFNVGTAGSHSFKIAPAIKMNPNEEISNSNEVEGKLSSGKSVSVKIPWMTQKIRVTAKEIAAGTVSLNWTSVSGIQTYEVRVKNVKSGVETVVGEVTGTNCTINGMTYGNKYTFTVKPKNKDGLTGNGGSVTVTMRINGFTPSSSTKTYRALVIGNTYGGDLPGCDRDANTMASMLGSMTATPYKVTKKLEATVATMKSAITTAFAGAKEGDVSLFYYSGHGMSSSGHLIGNSYGSSNSSDYMTFAQLRTALDKIPGDKIVILDSCYSGNAINKDPLSDQELEEQMEAYADAAMDAFTNVEPRAGELAAGKYYVITACTKSQTSSSLTMGSSGKSFGLFTRCFEEACGWDELNNKKLTMSADTNSDNKITLHEAFTKTNTLVNQWKANLTSLNLKQVTRVNPESSSFVLFGRK